MWGMFYHMITLFLYSYMVICYWLLLEMGYQSSKY